MPRNNKVSKNTRKSRAKPVATTPITKPITPPVAQPVTPTTKPTDTTTKVDLITVTSPATPITRDKWLWPFSTNSIWNMPIGSNAVYVDADIKQATYYMCDPEHLHILNAGDPLRPVLSPGGWSGGRCNPGGSSMGVSLPIPDSLIIPDSVEGRTPNNCSAFLMPDGRTVEQLEPTARCAGTAFINGYRNPWGGVDIYGEGIIGTHFGSGLSTLGGSIRLGELIRNEPIRHAIKILLWGQTHLFYDANSPTPGYRWPATNADGAAPTNYNGTNPKLVEGCLLALPPNLTEVGLGIQTIPGKKIFRVLQDYGGYICDDSGWDVHYFPAQFGVVEEFDAFYGFPFETGAGPWWEDLHKIYTNLYIVDNNSPTNVGGGGTPRAPLAPPLIPPA